MKPDSLHEDLSRKDDVKVGSERSFGLVFAAVFLVIGLFPIVRSELPHFWAIGVSAVFLLLAFLAPRLLRPFNIIWFRLGLLMHRVVSPVILALIFYLAILPIGLIYKILGKDPLQLNFEKDRATYWISRDPPGPQPDTMRDQF